MTEFLDKDDIKEVNMTQITIDLEQLGEIIAKRIPPAVPLDKRPWGAEKCASYLDDMSVSYFLQNIAARPDFPKSTKIAGGHRKWKAGEVIDWTMAHWDRQENRRKPKKNNGTEKTRNNTV